MNDVVNDLWTVIKRQAEEIFFDRVLKKGKTVIPNDLATYCKLRDFV